MGSNRMGKMPGWFKSVAKVWGTLNDPIGLLSGSNNYQGLALGGEGGILGIGDMMGITNPAEPISTPTVPSSTAPVSASASDEAAAKARRDFLAKQALLSSKNSTVKTNSLGVASDTLQTSKKTLLGG
jgi:hypothetical protein